VRRLVCAAFVGETLRIVTDQDPTLAYSFRSTNGLSVAENGGRAVDAAYAALALDHAPRTRLAVRLRSGGTSV
jgi:hypothetical protein